jgi:hypothetical protein
MVDGIPHMRTPLTTGGASSCSFLETSFGQNGRLEVSSDRVEWYSFSYRSGGVDELDEVLWDG